MAGQLWLMDRAVRALLRVIVCYVHVPVYIASCPRDIPNTLEILMHVSD